MGTLCPTCQTHQPYKRWITVNNQPTRKASDVLGAELGCGHLFGNEEFMSFQAEVDKVRVAYAETMIKAEQTMKNSLSAAWIKIQAAKEVS